MAVENRFVDLLLEKMRDERRVISLTEVAKKCGMSRQYVHKWFTGQVSSCPFKTMAAFCAYFNCTPNDLFVIKHAEIAQ